MLNTFSLNECALTARSREEGKTMGENPIALRSKKKLTRALYEIMDEKPYKDITITELCERASLSRPAFYQNFTKMDDVLVRLMNETINSAIEKTDFDKIKNVHDLVDAYLKIFEDNEDKARILAKNNLAWFMVNQCTEVLASSPKAFDLFKKISPDVDKASCYADFFSAGLAYVLGRWIMTDVKLPREEIVSYLTDALLGEDIRKIEYKQ